MPRWIESLNFQIVRRPVQFEQAYAYCYAEVIALKLRFWQRKRVWWPTWQGWLLGTGLGFLIFALGIQSIESFLSVDDPVSAKVLVVEGWVDPDGLPEAVAEYRRGDYEYMVAVGSIPNHGWLRRKGISFAEIAAEELRNLGVPIPNILTASRGIIRRHRTFE